MLQTKAVPEAALALLEKICSLSKLEKFALVGGTNLALRYGHRVSVDLDFFTTEPYHREEIQAIISKHFPSAELLFEQNQTMLFFIHEIRVDFVLYPFPWKFPIETINNFRLAAIEDIIPMKLQAIENRKSKKDFWDIDLLITQYGLPEMLRIFHAKFPNIDPGYLIHNLVDFENAELQMDPDTIVEKSWEEIKANIVREVNAFVSNQINN
jgi:predicted nucleotidyltransferase component of viral defense system